MEMIIIDKQTNKIEQQKSRFIKFRIWAFRHNERFRLGVQFGLPIPFGFFSTETSGSKISCESEPVRQNPIESLLNSKTAFLCE